VPTADNYYEWDGTVYSSDYEALDPRVSFYHLFVCASGRYTEKDYLAGAMVFGNNHGLLAVASTDVTYTFPYNEFYKAMSQRQTLGDAFLKWLSNASTDFAERISSTDSSSSVVLDESQYEALVHNTVLIGDPTLQLQIENHNVRIGNVTATLQNSSDAATLIVSVTVQNAGDFRETFNATVHIDSDLVYRSQLTLEPGNIETITFSPSNASKYIWSNFIHHRVRAEISPLPEEFDVEDNIRDEYYVSKIVQGSALMRVPDALFALSGILIFGLMGYGFIRLLMSDKPLNHLQTLLMRIGLRIKAALLHEA
jgi:hypothetical protein